MNIIVVSAGKPHLTYARMGMELYLDRLRPFGNTELKIVKEGSPEEVSNRLLVASEGCVRIAMDERGALWTTSQLADSFKKWELQSVKKVAFLIGAADGHTQALRHSCQHIWALGKITLQHELALVVLLEQLYRVRTILSGTPYHR